MKTLGSPNQVAHFWLHPVLLCEVEKQLRSHFEKFNYKLKAPSSLYCTNFKSLDKLDSTIVITHDALLPWLKSTSSNVLLINVHDDHHEMTPSQMKKLVKEVKKSSSVHWIIETQFHHPPSLERLISKNHKVLRINTTGLTKQKTGSILKTLNTFLKE
ncbi:MAG: hypothetical protein KC493_07270 [Bacteriovoracaceae bacterium]|nr:hypothetical protein [Bacteriovoracaceae bacterium]